jgi:hypothetical protein
MAGQWKFRNLTPAEAQAMRNDPRYRLVGESGGVEGAVKEGLEFVEHPKKFVMRWVLRHGMSLVSEAQKDPAVRRAASAALASGGQGAAAKVFEAHYIKQIEKATGIPWPFSR